MSCKLWFKLCFCLYTALMQTSQSAMNEGLKDGHYIDFWQEDENRFMCIRLKSVTDICDKVRTRNKRSEVQAN